MKSKLFNLVFASMIGLALVAAEAEAAKRLGGGRNVGTQRESIQQQAPRPPQQAPQQSQQATPQGAPAAAAAAAPAAASGASRWLGPIAGLAAGGLLGAMLFGGAFEGIKFMDVLMILLLVGGVFFIFKMMRRPQPQQARPEPMQYAGVGADPRVEPEMKHIPAAPQPAAQPSASAATSQSYLPAGFDAEAFARQAKQNFIRLQEANDRKDITSLRDVMTPAMFREIEAAMAERDAGPQKTEVVTLDAQVVEVVTEGPAYVASVRFSGLIKEDGGQPEQFSEIWHLQKPTNGSSGWLVAGIQQN